MGVMPMPNRKRAKLDRLLRTQFFGEFGYESLIVRPDKPELPRGEKPSEWFFDTTSWTWQRKEQWVIDREVALAELDQQFPGIVEEI